MREREKRKFSGLFYGFFSDDFILTWKNRLSGWLLGAAGSIIVPMMLPLLTHARSIYGGDVVKDDNRQEVNQVGSRLIQEQARSVALITTTKTVTEGVNATRITGPLIKDYAQLNAATRFADQPDLGQCTGFLVAPNLLLTARHCTEPESMAVTSEDVCKNMRIVFDVTLEKLVTDHDVRVPTTDLFRCKAMHPFKDDPNSDDEMDLALIELDRVATGHVPLKLSEAAPAKGNKVYTLGHPLGMPMKYTGTDPLLAVLNTQIKVQLDTFHGCSGSPIFDENTNEVVGVLVDGGTDFRTLPDGSHTLQRFDPRDSWDEDTMAESGMRVDFPLLTETIRKHAATNVAFK